MANIPNTSEQIKIKYEVHQKLDNTTDVNEAIIRHDLIHSPGYGLFATPSDLKETDKIKITINWLGIDQNWKTVSSYGTKKSIHLVMTVRELLHAMYIAGKLRVYPIGSDSSHVFLSLHGDFDIPDQKIVSDLK